MFYELFQEMANDLGWSQNFIAKEFDINRGLLHKYSKGEAMMPQDKFHLILNEMELNVPKKTTLCTEYYREKYGDIQLNKIKYIEKALSEADQVLNTPPVKPVVDGKDVSKLDKIIFLNSEKEITNMLNNIFTSISAGEIITNYPYSFKFIDDALFNNICSSSDFSLLHLLEFDSGKDSLNNIVNIFSSLRWLAYQINPIYTYNHTERENLSVFKYFVAVDSYCILFDDDLSGIYIKNDKVFNRLKSYSEKVANSGFPVGFMPKNMLELKNQISSQNKIAMDISGYPCVSAVIDNEFISAVINKDFAGVDIIAAAAVEHYSSYSRSQDSDMKKQLTSASGLSEFAYLGKVQEFPSVLVNTVPPDQRVRFLEKNIEFVKNDTLMIIDDTAYNISKEILIDFFDDIIIGGMFKNVDKSMRYKGNYTICIQDACLKNDLKLFFDWICDTKKLYSKNTAENFLNSLIILCKGLK